MLRDTQLLRLNFGIFSLHAAQMGMFVVLPFALRNTSNLDINHQWEIYLPVVLVSFVLMVPAIIYGETRGKLKQVFVAAIATMLAAQLGMSASMHHFWGIVAALILYFVAFNILEASLPSLISKLAPTTAKGTAMGVYNTSQSLGLFFGGAMGGWLSRLGWARGAMVAPARPVALKRPRSGVCSGRGSKAPAAALARGQERRCLRRRLRPGEAGLRRSRDTRGSGRFSATTRAAGRNTPRL